MPNCKYCGQPVTAAPVFHTACWKAKLEDAAQIFCDQFCRWPWLCQDQEDLEEHCNGDCPFLSLLNL